MRGLGIAIALAGLLAVATTIHVARDRVAPSSDAAAAVAISDEPPPVGQTPSPVDLPVRSLPVRPVAPALVPPPPLDPGELSRVEPREPLSPIGRAHVPSEGPPEARPLHRPVAEAAGIFVAQGYAVQLAGIVPTAADATCGDAAWPCGIHARTAFRNLLRGRALTCVVPPAPPDEVMVRDCLLGKVDPAAWLVERGWVMAEAGGPHVARQEAARQAGLGLFGPAPQLPDLAPVDLTPPEPLTLGTLGPSGG